MDDAAIARKVVNGDVESFAHLIKKYEAYVIRITSRHLPRDIAIEAAHDTFVRAYEKLHTYGGEKPFGHWLARIAVNTCAETWRSKKRLRETSLDYPGDETGALVSSIIDSASVERHEDVTRQAEARELLSQLLDKLSPEDRIVVVMIHLEGLAVEEASEMLGWSVSKVKVRAHRARLKMRGEMEKLLA